MIIPRKDYIDRLGMYMDRAEIKVLTGLRRTGKTTILRQFIDFMRDEGIPGGNIFYLDLESMSLAGLSNAGMLRDLCLSFIHRTEGKKYIILDEVQSIPGWAEIASEMMNLFDASLIVSSSNNTVFNEDFMGRFKYRYIRIDVYPLSFGEYLKWDEAASSARDKAGGDPDDGNAGEAEPTGTGDLGADKTHGDANASAPSKKDSFLKYLKTGFMPGVYSVTEPVTAKDYLKGIYSTVILHDVIKARKLRDVSHIEKIMEYVLGHVGDIYSPKTIRDYIAARGTTISVDTVYAVLEALTGAYILYKVPRYDAKNERALDTKEKYYLPDPAMADALTDREMSLRARMESAVAVELMRRGFKLYVGKYGANVTDFMAQRGGDRTYLNITETVAEKQAEKEAFGPLTRVRDNYFKMVLSLDDSTIVNKGGIINYPIVDFLSEG